MKELFVVTFWIWAVVLCRGSAHAQGPSGDTTAVNVPPRWSLSQLPDQAELGNVFARIQSGHVDLYDALERIGERGDKAIAGLGAFLRDFRKAPDSLRQHRVFAVMALGEVGSTAAFPFLSSAARQREDQLLRGTALNILAVNHYERVVRNDLIPDKSVVHELVQAVDDSTYVQELSVPINEIARMGLMNWLGRDFGTPDTGTVVLQTGGAPRTVTIRQFRELWWQRVNPKIRWNHQLARFEIP